MSQTSSREFKAGTTGWTLDDLRDPEIRRLWDAGHFEIIDGVLTPMPAARLGHGGPIGHLIFLLKTYSATKSLGTSTPSRGHCMVMTTNFSAIAATARR